MLVATHMLVGAKIYQLITKDSSNLLIIGIGLTSAFVSHFVLDTIPHFDLNIPQNFFIGLPVICLLLYLAYKTLSLPLLIAAFLGALPDIMFILKFGEPINTFHHNIHYKGVVYPFLLIVELIFLATIATVFIRILVR